MKAEEWTVGCTATAIVIDHGDFVSVTLHGLLTSIGYEELFRRLCARRFRRVAIILTTALLVAATCRSLAEAAGRSMPIDGAPEVIAVEAPTWRSVWARMHAEWLSVEGVSCSAAGQAAGPLA